MSKNSLQIIGLQPSMLRTKVDWQYDTERANGSSLGTINGTYWPRGKMLGGSSAINGAMYIRGNQDDYNEWERLGNVGWAWNDVLKYFIKSEYNLNPEVVGSYGGNYHGIGGYLSVERYGRNNAYSEILRQATIEAGYKQLLDLNGEEHIGYGRVQLTAEGATRASTAKAFLNTIQNRKNLHIIKNAFVVSLHYESGNAVRGVNMIVDNQYSLRAVASKEVILSAGAINTPQLLMLSGIGRREYLEPFNIPIRSELDVGGNLQDHVFIPIFFGIGKPISNITKINQEVLLDLFDFTLRDRGTFIYLNRIDDIMGFANTENSGAKFPNIQFINKLIPKNDTNALGYYTSMGYKRNILDSIRSHIQRQDVAIVWVVGIDPKSRGRLRIKSGNPYDHPIIETGYFNDPNDLDVLREGIRMQQNLFNMPAFRNYETSELRIDIPECEIWEYNSNDFWECYIRHMSTTIYHACGSAKMGPWSDPGAVVDSQLKVFGVERLRVVDASIMPTITSGNTNAPTIMIAEKGADMIKNAHA
ncbi:glucose dehydrogenase [FAD, quinone]-like [Aedes aegypti]|uniref:Glucose-methanol-choline oxidoreductase N-terminal domain-containing protein n=1 Tax=Aedes aegypti TaxID=7159 RepID=A0A6I8U8P2_AEDAE|nr:glucose dehydrogenase [FAD, quinone]-like [Aedes aegypti]